MVDVISARTPEGEPFRCPVCGMTDQIEPSRPPGDAPCPSCGTLVWLPPHDPINRRSRALLENADTFLRLRSRRPMLGVVATVARQARRVWAARPRRRNTARPVETSGVYDHWLDG